MICEAALCIQQLREYKVLDRERERDRASERARARARERERRSLCLPLHLSAWVCFCGVDMFRYNVVVWLC